MFFVNSEKKTKIKNIVREWWIYLLPFCLFIYWAITGEPVITNDTPQYIAMHIKRDPLYPLFLLLFRSIFGEESYLTEVIWFQNICGWLSVCVLTESIKRIYIRDLGRLWFRRGLIALVCFIATLPHLITPLAAKTGLVLTNTIMSEALALSLFYLYVSVMLGGIESDHMWSSRTWMALILSWLMSLIRGQMQVFIIACFIVSAIHLIRLFIKKSLTSLKQKPGLDLWLKLGLLCLVFACSFAIRGFAIKGYNLIFNNHFIPTTFSEVSMLTNVVYAATPDMSSYIEDEEARRFFDATMTLADEEGLNYRYCEKGLMNRAADLDMIHDTIKFKCIDECWRPIHDAEYPLLANDYELETAEQDRIAGIIIKDILPHCLGVWLYDYIALCVYGFIRTVSIVHPILNVWALLVYLAILLIGLCLFKKKMWKPLRLLAVSMLLVCANVCGTATVIMCLSRYMIYTLPLVYIALLIVLSSIMCYHTDVELENSQHKKNEER